MKLYYSKGACSLAVRIIINEIGLSCQYEAVDLASKKTQSGENFLKINPKGYVPALLTDDKKILTENIAIQQYLADTHPAAALLPPLGNWNRYLTLEWLAYISTELHKNFGPLFNPNFDKALVQNFFIPMLHKKFAYVDQQLGHKKFLMGDQFTLPDAYLFVILRWAQHLQLDLSKYEQLNRYFKELSHRKSVQQSLREEA